MILKKEKPRLRKIKEKNYKQSNNKDNIRLHILLVL